MTVGSSGSDSDNSFEDVKEKDGYEADIPTHLKNLAAQGDSIRPGSTSHHTHKATTHQWHPEVGDVEDPTSSAATINVLRKKIRYTKVLYLYFV